MYPRSLLEHSASRRPAAAGRNEPPDPSQTSRLPARQPVFFFLPDLPPLPLLPHLPILPALLNRQLRRGALPGGRPAARTTPPSSGSLPDQRGRNLTPIECRAMAAAYNPKDDVDRLFACFKCGVSPPRTLIPSLKICCFCFPVLQCLRILTVGDSARLLDGLQSRLSGRGPSSGARSRGFPPCWGLPVAVAGAPLMLPRQTPRWRR